MDRYEFNECFVFRGWHWHLSIHISSKLTCVVYLRTFFCFSFKTNPLRTNGRSLSSRPSASSSVCTATTCRWSRSCRSTSDTFAPCVSSRGWLMSWRKVSRAGVALQWQRVIRSSPRGGSHRLRLVLLRAREKVLMIHASQRAWVTKMYILSIQWQEISHTSQIISWKIIIINVIC